jgi:RHS repeat-associated protein
VESLLCGRRTRRKTLETVRGSLGEHTTTLANWHPQNQAGYDAAGKVLSDGLNQYLYDGEGRICASKETVDGTTVMTGYVYDADGARVAKGSITVWSCDPSVNGVATAGNETDYILGPGGEQVTEVGMDANGNMAHQHTNVWAGGKLLATYDDNGLHFYLDDPLGTRRVTTDYAGVVEQSCTSLPYGDGESCPPTPTEHLFTGKERDSESGNDYFEARYYASSMGRFLTPDWSDDPDPVPYAELEKPQTLNLYSYVENNPLRSTDPDGHYHQECTHTTTTSTDANGHPVFHVTENCTTVPDFWDYPGIWATKAGVATRNFANNHPNFLGTRNCPPRGCTQLYGLPWGMTGGLSLASAEEAAVSGVLKQIANGTTKGKEFLNLDGKLPAQAAGYYKAFTAPLAGQVGRGASRVVTGQGGEVYYTADHYATFTRVK